MDQKIVPCLWFDDRIEDAANFYVSVFPDSRITTMSRYTASGPLDEGKVLVAMFELNGQQFMAINGGPRFSFSEAISFYVSCESQAEVDHYWNALLADGGEESQCGWLKDRFGLSWQVVPSALGRYLSDPDPERSGRVMQAMLQMQRIVIADLDAAYQAG